MIVCAFRTAGLVSILVCVIQIDVYGAHGERA